MTMQRKIYRGTPVIINDERIDPARMARAWVKDEMREIRANMLSMASANQPGEKGWFVLQVVSGREKAVENLLREKGVMSYLPLVQGGVKMVRGHKVRSPERPAFAGYVMVSVVPSAAAFAGLVSVRNVEDILGGAQKPHRVSDETMSRFKIMLGDWAEATARAKDFNKGDWVEFDEGPFAGFKGHIVKLRKMVLIRGEKPVAVEGVVEVDIGGRVSSVTTPLALLVKL
ncbi:transcription termination/antitermination protein NusG [Sinorhizobium americanum]|uniref:Transcriptional antiterminator NusG n=1 Tax=Sinorhizobium americanum TaxID=194963 RepID=A0A4R2BRR2_9HYPH|nr:transcription termination/antitermination NusG family protein [Sinorhizobium americanum]TCN30321.1 transcriptional antiterminator NusG [Sinorhizobium americanum]